MQLALVLSDCSSNVAYLDLVCTGAYLSTDGFQALRLTINEFCSDDAIDAILTGIDGAPWTYEESSREVPGKPKPERTIASRGLYSAAGDEVSRAGDYSVRTG